MNNSKISVSYLHNIRLATIELCKLIKDYNNKILENVETLIIQKSIAYKDFADVKF